MFERRALTDPIAVQDFIFGGKATFTLVSKKTGERFTFKVTRKTDELSFVMVMTSGDNEDGFTYLGTLRSGAYGHGRKSPIGADAPSARAFAWFITFLGTTALEKVDFWHEGRCCRCNRKLTVPSSIESGIGPECARKFKAEAA